MGDPLGFESKVKLGITLTYLDRILCLRPFESKVKLGITLTKRISHYEV